MPAPSGYNFVPAWAAATAPARSSAPTGPAHVVPRIPVSSSSQPQLPPPGHAQTSTANDTPTVLPFFRGFNKTVGSIGGPLADALYRGFARYAQAAANSDFAAAGRPDLMQAPAPPTWLPSEAYNEAFVGAPQSGIVGQTLDHAGEFVGESVPMMAATSGRAGTMLRAAADNSPGLWNAAKRAANTVLDYIAAEPVAVTVSDATQRALSGAGAEAGKRSGAPDGEAIGAVSGPWAPNVRYLSPTFWRLKTALLLGEQLPGGIVPKGIEWPAAGRPPRFYERQRSYLALVPGAALDQGGKQPATVATSAPVAQ